MRAERYNKGGLTLEVVDIQISPSGTGERMHLYIQGKGLEMNKRYEFGKDDFLQQIILAGITPEMIRAAMEANK